MKNKIASHPFDALAEHFAELVAQHLTRSGAARGAGGGGGPIASVPLKKGQKRSRAVIEQTTERLLAHIKANKGQRIEEIARELGVTTKDLKLSAQKLLGDKAVKTKGNRRATRYFPA